LTIGALTSAVLALVSSLLIYYQLKLRDVLTPCTLLVGGGFYLVFVGLVFTGVIY